MQRFTRAIRNSKSALAALLQGRTAEPVELSEATKERIVPIEAFHLNFSDRLDGWLDGFTARRTSDLLDFQVRTGTRGPLYEVGVYKGKYLSVLLRSALLSGDRLFGIDVFNATTRGEFEAYFKTMMDLEFHVEILEGLSTSWSAYDLIRIFGGEVRFVSIDGSHEYEDVLWDLKVASAVASPACIISADDFFNPECLGTNQAINYFLSHSDEFKPFVYLPGKMLMCRPSYVPAYQGELIRCMAADVDNPKSVKFTQMYGGPYSHSVMPKFHGVPTIQLH